MFYQVDIPPTRLKFLRCLESSFGDWELKPPAELNKLVYLYLKGLLVKGRQMREECQHWHSVYC